MTDTVMPVSPYAAVGCGVSGYGRDDDCLSEVVLANQISSGFADNIAATHTAAHNVISDVTQHGLRNNDAINQSTRSIEKAICDHRVGSKEDHCETQKLLLEKFGSLQNQMTSQHCEVKQLFLQQTNEQLKAELLDAKLAALHPAS